MYTARGSITPEQVGGGYYYYLEYFCLFKVRWLTIKII